MRRAMYEEIDEDQWDKLVKELERFYKKDGKPELDRYCLQFDVTLDPGNSFLVLVRYCNYSINQQ